MIEKSEIEKSNVEQMLARDALEKYLLSKRYEEQMRKETLEKRKHKKVRIEHTSEEVKEQKEEGEDIKNEVDDLMKDQKKFANIQKIMNQDHQEEYLSASNNQRIQEMQMLADSIFEMHCQGQYRHEVLKKTIHYKYPQ